MKILKFGGTAIASGGTLAALAAHIKLTEPAPLIVVTSAADALSDQFLNACHLAASADAEFQKVLSSAKDLHVKLLRENLTNADAAVKNSEALFGEVQEILNSISMLQDVPAKTLDLVLCIAERLTLDLVAETLRAVVPDLKVLDARDFIKSDRVFGAAKIKSEQTAILTRQAFSGKQRVTVVAGAIASTDTGETTTLGRGGADGTAALIAAALGAEEIEVWSNVDGIMTADPKRVSRAFTIPQLSYEEALELSHFGTRVIFTAAMQPAISKKIPIRIRNAFAPEHPGTVISDEPRESAAAITGISSIGNVALLQLEGSGMIGVAGTAKRLFDALSRSEISVILISQASSEHSICFAITPDAVNRAKSAIAKEFAFEIGAQQIELLTPEYEHSIVAIVGANMRHTTGISGKLFQALGKNGINVAAIAQGSSELNISVVIDRIDESKTLNALHDAFFLSDSKTVNLFLVGVGQVGKKLIEQLDSQAAAMKRRKLELRLVGAADSKMMYFDPEGISLSEVSSRLKSSKEKMNAIAFISKLRQLNLPNSIFIDCSASEEMADAYSAILRSSISIVTPNKRANSGPLARYRLLKEQAQKANVKFFYETNVGAGLPVIGTLNDLISSGDEIIKIEAVLSGTLSYIFNSYTAGKTFSEIVREAKAKGYTEPDPRDDLSGRDVARKLLILCREIGLALEERDVEVQSLVSAECAAAASVEEYFKRLQSEDAEFEKLRAGAESKGSVLRYIASIENGGAKVSLQPVSSSHPFYLLSGSDNVISFTTARYRERPLVVKGPGAGVDVTAAGVLADIIRVASYLS